MSIILLNSLMFFFLCQVQVRWLKRNLGKVFPDLWVTPKKYPAAMEFCKTKMIGYLSSFFFWKGHSSSTVLPCLGALEQTQLWSRVGEKVSWVLNLACLVPLCMGWHLISKDDSYRFWFHFLHWWTLEVESSQHAGLSWTFGLDLWRSAFRRRT